jgi:hypothetical protein
MPITVRRGLKEMTQLRLIRKRELNQEEQFDLRGLGQEEVFTDSAPYGCLTIKGARDAAQMESALRAYRLETQISQHKNVLHLVCGIRIAGEHKRQAVTLFMAGLRLHHQFPTFKLHLGEVSQLHYQMERTFNFKELSTHTPDGIVRNWIEAPEIFSILGTVTYHLHQAGFHLPKQEGTLTLNGPHLDQLYQEATTEEASPVTHRKVG